MSNWIFIFSGDTIAAVLLCVHLQQTLCGGALPLEDEPSIKSRYGFTGERLLTNTIYLCAHPAKSASGEKTTNNKLGSCLATSFSLFCHNRQIRIQVWCLRPCRVMEAGSFGCNLNLKALFFWGKPMSRRPCAGSLNDTLMLLQKDNGAVKLHLEKCAGSEESYGKMCLKR